MNNPIQDDPALLDAMWSDMLEQEALYRPGPYWEGKAATSRKLLHRLGLSGFRSTAIGTSYADNVVLDPLDNYLATRCEIPARIAAQLPFLKGFFALHRHWIKAYHLQARAAEAKLLQFRLSDWLKEVSSGFPELPSSIEEACPASVEIENRDYAVYYLRLLSYISLLENSDGVDLGNADSLIEVGGGLGANLHLLLTRYPNIRKVVLVDLPTTLYVSTQYLKKFFTGVRDYSATRGKEKICFEGGADELEILTLCPWQLPNLEAEIDVAWNSHSFVEMAEPQIDFYCEQFSRLLAPRDGKGVFVSYDDVAGGAVSLKTLTERLSSRFELTEHSSTDWDWWWDDRIFTGSLEADRAL